MRETVFAGLFGASMQNDAFVAAYRIPNLLRDLLAEGALSAAFVSTYSQTLAGRGRENAFALSNRLTSLLVPSVTGICIVGTFLAPWIVAGLFPGYAAVEGKFELTVLLTRILMPFLLLIVLAAKAMGVLNSHGTFGLPALSSAFFNVVSVSAGVFLGFVLGPELGIQPIIGMAIGTLAGGAIQYLCQVPSLRATGLSFRWMSGFGDPGVRQVLRLMGPATIGAAAVQVNVMVNGMFASGLADAAGRVINGPVSWLGYSFRFMQLPLGLFGIALAAATLPTISREAGAGRLQDFRETLSKSLGLVLLLTIPSAVGLFVLSRQLIGLVYERGQFTASDTEQTALALSFYCLGLAGYAATKILAPAFYALDDVRVPMSVSLFSIVLNYSMNKLFIDILELGTWALALSTALVATLNSLLLLGAMRSRLDGIGGRRLLASSLKIAAASCVMGASCWICANAVEAWIGAGTFTGRLTAVAVSVPMGVTVIYTVCSAMRVPELDFARRAILARVPEQSR